MPAATKADVDKVNEAVVGLGGDLADLKSYFDTLRSTVGLSPASAPGTTAAAPRAATNWTPIILLAGAGLVLFLLIKKGGT